MRQVEYKEILMIARIIGNLHGNCNNENYMFSSAHAKDTRALSAAFVLFEAKKFGIEHEVIFMELQQPDSTSRRRLEEFIAKHQVKCIIKKV